MWMTSINEDDPEHGIHCSPLTNAGTARKAWSSWRLLVNLLKEIPAGGA